MYQFLFAFAVFIALHSIPATPSIRQSLIAALGRRQYLIAYSIVSTLALAWLFYAALNTDYIPLWDPAAWQAWITLVAAPLGLFLVIAGLLSANPLSISFRQMEQRPGAIVGITRHPVMWGFILWSLGHVVPNGDLRSLILFGGFAAFSTGGLFMLERRARKRLGPEWTSISASTSLLPFQAILRSKAGLRIDAPMAVAAAATALLTTWLLTGGHEMLFGVDPLVLAFWQG